jgi:hypothetical protein
MVDIITLGQPIKSTYEAEPNTNAFTNAEKTKLAAIQADAEVNAVDSVNGQIGAVVLDKDDVGLENVDNTSDADKPVSTATGAAISALSTVANFRGTVIGNLWPGVVEGTGLNQAARIQNGLSLQAALNFASDNGKFFELEPGIYEIELDGGLQVPFQNSTNAIKPFVWRGVYGTSKIVQYANNTPALVIGRISGGEASKTDFDGVGLGYGNDQAGNTNANLCYLGGTWRSWIKNIDAGQYGSARPYNSCRINGGTYWFSNILESCTFGQAYNSLLLVSRFGTGNVFRNLYCVGQGAPNIYDLSGRAVSFDSGGSAQYENVIEQLNIEWAQSSQMLRTLQTRNMTFISTHFEGCRLKGFDPSYIYMEGSQLNFIGLTGLNNKVRSADGVTGQASLFNSGHTSDLTTNGTQWFWDAIDSAGVDAPQVTVPFVIHRRGSFDRKNQPQMVNSNVTILSDNRSGLPNLAQVKLTDDTTAAAFNNIYPEKWNELKQFSMLPEIQGAKLRVPASTTIWGMFKNSRVMVDTTIAAQVDIKLSNKLAPSGTIGANVNVEPGRMIQIYRSTGTATGNLVRVLNHDDAVITTVATSDTEANIVFNGSDWQLSTADALTGSLMDISIPISDISNDIEVGTNKAFWIAPFDFYLTELPKLYVDTAPTGSVFSVDIMDDGTSIFSTKLTVDAGENSSNTAATPAVFTNAAARKIIKGSKVRIDVLAVGSTIPGAGAMVTLIGQRAI